MIGFCPVRADGRFETQSQSVVTRIAAFLRKIYGREEGLSLLFFLNVLDRHKSIAFSFCIPVAEVPTVIMPVFFFLIFVSQFWILRCGVRV